MQESEYRKFEEEEVRRRTELHQMGFFLELGTSMDQKGWPQCTDEYMEEMRRRKVLQDSELHGDLIDKESCPQNEV